MRKYFIKFLYKSSLLLIPFICLLIIYVYFDPFKVLYKYKTYFNSGYPVSHISLDKDYTSTQTFINNTSKYRYNAFIFGDSRSMFYEVATWKKYIQTDDCFHFDASSESLLGIYKKIKFLEKNNIPISHALIIWNYNTLAKTPFNSGHLTLMHPALSNQNWASFQLEFFKAFISPHFLIAYLDLKISKQFKNYMKGALATGEPIEYNIKYNEIKYKSVDSLINTSPSKYFDAEQMKVFFKQDTIQKYSPQAILEPQYKMLLEISEILKNKRTSYKIIINPLFDQLKLNSKDLKILDNIFGKNNVFDFSGINSITSDYQNYYEPAHYRPRTANYIMEKIYE